MRRALASIVAAGLLASIATTAVAQQNCVVDDTSTKEVLPGVVLTYDSSHRCDNAPDEGTYSITVRVTNAEGSAEAVLIDELSVRGTTPRPRENAPDATATAGGLPITVEPGETGWFRVSGSYELVSTDEGNKANLHLTASGEGVESGLPFDLGINVHLRGEGATEGGDDGADAGGGPPPWAGRS